MAADAERVDAELAADVGRRAARGVWAVGAAGTVVHWDGTEWTPFDSLTDLPITGVFAARTDDVWAVGFRSVMRHWDGRAWHPIELPAVADPDPAMRADYPFHGLAGTAPDDVWEIATTRPVPALGRRDVDNHARRTKRRELGQVFAFDKHTAHGPWARHRPRRAGTARAGIPAWSIRRTARCARCGAAR